MKNTKLVFGLVFLIFLVSFVSAETYYQEKEYTFFNDKIVEIGSINSFIPANYSDHDFTSSINSANSTVVECYIGGSYVFADPNENYVGKSYCDLVMNDSSNNLTLITNMSINLIALDYLKVEDITYIGDDTNVGGGTTTTTVEYNIIERNITQNVSRKELLPDKVIVSSGDVLFEITTDVGTSYFEMFGQPDSQRKRNLYVTNNGLSKLNLSLDCEGDLCSHIEYREKFLNIPPEYTESMPIKINIPDDVKDGDVLNFKLIVSLMDDENIQGSIDGTIKIDPLLGYISSVISFDNLFNDGYEVAGIFFSNLIITLILTSLYFTSVSLLIIFSNFRGTSRFVFEMLRWLGSLFMFILIILLL